MIDAVVYFFTMTKAGRTIALVGAGVLAIGIAILKAFNSGKATERETQGRQSLDNMRERAKIDGEVEGLGHADVDERMSRWVRDK